MIDEKGNKKNLANIESGMTIFKFLKAKDIFEAFYTQRLTKRLVLSKSNDNELETELI